LYAIDNTFTREFSTHLRIYDTFIEPGAKDEPTMVPSSEDEETVLEEVQDLFPSRKGGEAGISGGQSGSSSRR
jgi:hypothetical protein